MQTRAYVCVSTCPIVEHAFLKADTRENGVKPSNPSLNAVLKEGRPGVAGASKKHLQIGGHIGQYVLESAGRVPFYVNGSNLMK